MHFSIGFGRIPIFALCFIGASILLDVNSIDAQRTFLDKFINQYRSLRGGLFKFIGSSDTDSSYYWNLKRQKVQKPFPKSAKFPCDVKSGRSKAVPTSVHKLRPGDIDVISAMGDSLTAGNGALATNILQVLIENKGVSWSIGGRSRWQKFLTLPNILREFNPQLYGFSESDGFSTDRDAKFNVAEIGAMSRDIPYEAKVLVKRMRSDPNVDIENHWKMVTILIGPNDFCLDLCYQASPEKSIERHRLELIETLTILRDNLPRTIVNLVTPPSMKVIYYLNGKPSECISTHHIECPCIFSFKFEHQRQRYFKIMEQWQIITTEIPELNEFNDKPDFAVVNQPFLRNVRFPRLSNGNNDFTYMSVDCFHLSQKGYAIAANGLWNNIIEPYGNKSTNWKKEFTHFKCPTDSHPYISTKENSS